MKFLKQLSIIMGVSFLAEIMEYLIPLPVAASIYGLALMLTGLITGVIPLEKVEGAADFLVEIMPLVFVPPTVSLIANMEALAQMAAPLLAICTVTTILVMGVTGRTAQWIMGKDRKNADSRQDSARSCFQECAVSGMDMEEENSQRAGMPGKTVSMGE